MSPAAVPPVVMALLATGVTVGVYLAALRLKALLKTPLANPVLIAIVVIGAMLRVLHVSYAEYFTGAKVLHFLLGPATVALAIPLVRSLAHIRSTLWPMLAALGAGATVGIVSGYGLARLCGASQLVALSMAPKAATTPIAISVSQTIGGVPALSAVFDIAGGILVAISINPILGKLGWDEPAGLGLTAGTAGSGIGASQVIPQHTVAAAFAGVAIGLNGTMTAVLAPLLMNLLKRW